MIIMIIIIYIYIMSPACAIPHGTQPPQWINIDNASKFAGSMFIYQWVLLMCSLQYKKPTFEKSLRLRQVVHRHVSQRPQQLRHQRQRPTLRAEAESPAATAATRSLPSKMVVESTHGEIYGELYHPNNGEKEIWMGSSAPSISFLLKVGM